MFERFTQEARLCVVNAQEFTRRLNHDHIGTEHLLLGLLRPGARTVHPVLVRLGTTAEAVRAAIEETIGPGAGPPAAGHVPFTPRAKRALELSLREAQILRHPHIGPEHLLLGVLAEGSGVGATVLASLAIGVEAAREAVGEMTEVSGTPPESFESGAVVSARFGGDASAYGGMVPVAVPHLWPAAATAAIVLPLVMIVALLAQRPLGELARAGLIALVLGVAQATIGMAGWLASHARPPAGRGRVWPLVAAGGAAWMAPAAILLLLDALAG